MIIDLYHTIFYILFLILNKIFENTKNNLYSFTHCPHSHLFTESSLINISSIIINLRKRDEISNIHNEIYFSACL